MDSSYQGYRYYRNFRGNLPLFLSYEISCSEIAACSNPRCSVTIYLNLSEPELNVQLCIVSFSVASFDRQSCETCSKILGKRGSFAAKTTINVRTERFLFHFQKALVRSIEARGFPSTVKENEFNRWFSHQYYRSAQSRGSLHAITFNRRACWLVERVYTYFSSSQTFVSFSLFCLKHHPPPLPPQSDVYLDISGIFLAWTTVIGHNYFHMRDTFRMYYFDLSTMSSKDWRITHAMSHHTYPNTLWDYEIYSLEPFLFLLPDPKKSTLSSVVRQLASPLFWALGFYDFAIKRYVVAIYVVRNAQL